MSTRNQRRSQQIRLLLLGAATLTASGCQHLDPIVDSPTPYNTKVECQAYWGDECLREVQRLDPDGVQRIYWDIVSPSDVTQAEPEPEESIPVGQPFLTQVVGEVAKALTHVLRGGFGRSASRLGGAHA